MNYSIVINQLKTLAPMFGGNVAGAAAYARGVEDQVWLPLPAAYVVPLEEEAGENASMNGLYQVISERFQVIVVFDNSADRRGQSVTEQYDPTRRAVFSSILNWRPDSSADNPGIVMPGDPGADRSSRGIYSGGAALMRFDRGRLFYEWTFCLDVLFTEADGWQQPTEPLTEIQVNQGNPGSFDVTLPQ